MKLFLYLELFLIVIIGFFISYKVAELSNTTKKEVYITVKKVAAKNSSNIVKQEKKFEVTGKIFKKYGYVFLNNKKTKLDDKIKAGDIIKTSAHSYVVLKFTNGSILKVNPNSKIVVEHLEKSKDDTFKINLLLGTMLSHFSKRGKFKINTEVATVGVRGTTFFTEVLPKKQTVICACHGTIDFYNDKNKKNIISDRHQILSLTDKEFVKNVKPLLKSVMAGHNDNAITELKTISKSNETIKESTFDYTYSENRALLKKALDLIAKKKGKLALGLLNKISQKDPHASYLIAKILYEGIGIKKNKASAIKWFKKSAKKEFPSAVEYLSKL